MCHGHGQDCYKRGNKDVCECEHNTQGDNCNECKPKYRQRKWMPANETHTNACEECNCHGHSEKCIYNQTASDLQLSLNMNNKYEGGGVCLECQDNTEGINCEKCKYGYTLDKNSYYHRCIRCDCYQSPYYTGNCDPETGKCFCKKGYTGYLCQDCASGYYKSDTSVSDYCFECPCNINGTLSTGNQDNCQNNVIGCKCKPHVVGEKCDRCETGYWNFPFCQSRFLDMFEVS